MFDNKNLLNNGCIQLYREKLSFKFNEPNSSIYYDEMTQKFVFCTIKLNRTQLAAKTPSNVNVWAIEIPGNARITSVKISPDYDIVAIQRSSYYVELVVVTLSKQKQQLIFQSSSFKKSIINNFYWLDSSHIVLVTNSGVELYGLTAELTLKLLDKTVVECEWQQFYTDQIHCPLLIVGKDSHIHMYLFKESTKMESRRTIQLIKPNCSLSTTTNGSGLVHCTNTIKNDTKLSSSSNNKTTKFVDLNDKNIRLTLLYKTLFLLVHGVDDGLIYMYKIVDMCCLSKSTPPTCDHYCSSGGGGGGKKHKPTFVKSCSFILYYPMPPSITTTTSTDTNTFNVNPSINFLFDDDLIYVIVGMKKLIYLYDISLIVIKKNSTNGSLPPPPHLINPIDFLFTFHHYSDDEQLPIINNQQQHLQPNNTQQDQCSKLCETEGNYFMDSHHILFLHSNLILNTSNGTLWMLMFNGSYFIHDCIASHHNIVIQLLQRRTDSQKHILQLIHETLVIRDYTLSTARNLLDTIVACNIAAVVSFNVDTTNPSSIATTTTTTTTTNINNSSNNRNSISNSNDDTTNSLSSHMMHCSSSRSRSNNTLNVVVVVAAAAVVKQPNKTLIKPSSYVKSKICQENLFGTVFLPLMAGNVHSSSREKLTQNFMLKTILLHFVTQLSHHNVTVEGFLYEAIIELMIKFNEIFQLEQLYQHGLLPKRLALGNYLLGYCHQYPTLIVIVLDILLDTNPMQCIQLLLDNQCVNEAVRKYTKYHHQQHSSSSAVVAKIATNGDLTFIDSVASHLGSDKNVMKDNLYFSIFHWLKTHLSTLNVGMVPPKLLAQFKLRFGVFYN